MLQRAIHRHQTLTQLPVRCFAPPKKGGPPAVEASEPLIKAGPAGPNFFQQMVDSGDKEFIFGPPAGMNKPIGAHRHRIIHKMEPRI